MANSEKDIQNLHENKMAGNSNKNQRESKFNSKSFIHTRFEYLTHFAVTVIGENKGHLEFKMGGKSKMVNHSGGKF